MLWSKFPTLYLIFSIPHHHLRYKILNAKIFQNFKNDLFKSSLLSVSPKIPNCKSSISIPTPQSHLHQHTKASIPNTRFSFVFSYVCKFFHLSNFSYLFRFFYLSKFSFVFKFSYVLKFSHVSNFSYLFKFSYLSKFSCVTNFWMCPIFFWCI